MSDIENISDEDLQKRMAAARHEELTLVRELARRGEIRAKAAREVCTLRQAKDEDLVYASAARCPCGAGLAYHKNTDVRGAWECSDVLTGRAKPDTVHTEPLPFMFYSVKAEGQPSAYGATTRPATEAEPA